MRSFVDEHVQRHSYWKFDARAHLESRAGRESVMFIISDRTMNRIEQGQSDSMKGKIRSLRTIRSKGDCKTPFIAGYLKTLPPL